MNVAVSYDIIGVETLVLCIIPAPTKWEHGTANV